MLTHWSYVFLALTRPYLILCYTGKCHNKTWVQWVISLSHAPYDIDRLVQERRNASALSMELHLSCINPSIWKNFMWQAMWLAALMNFLIGCSKHRIGKSLLALHSGTDSLQCLTDVSVFVGDSTQIGKAKYRTGKSLLALHSGTVSQQCLTDVSVFVGDFTQIGKAFIWLT